MAKILFVDDEPHILSSLARSLRGNQDWECFFANSPLEALEVLARQDIAVLVSDHQMPQMTGAEFLSRVKEKRPNMVRIMLTGQASLKVMMRAVNDGAIYAFILKPWDDVQLKNTLRQAIELHHVTTDNLRLTELTRSQNEQLKELNESLEHKVELRTSQLRDALLTAQALNRDLQESLCLSAKTFFGILELARPEVGSHSRRVAEHARIIGYRMRLSADEICNLEVAALLHDIGKVGFPNFMLEKATEDLNENELKIYQSHPAIGAESLKTIAKYQDISQFVRFHHERYDGTGFPLGLKTTSVPLPAYIIGIIDEYERLINIPRASRQYQYQCAHNILSESARFLFPPKLVETVLDYIEETNNQRVTVCEKQISVAELRPSMVLTRDMYTVSGTLLLAKDARLTDRGISRIRSIIRIDPILGNVFVAVELEPDRVPYVDSRVKSGKPALA